MKAADYRGATFVVFLVASQLVAVGAEPVGSGMSTRLPVCAELEKAPTVELVTYLEKDRKSLSGSCVEFAVRQLEAQTDELSVADTERAISAVMPFLDFPSAMTGKSKWYPAKNTIVAVTNSVVQRLWDTQKDSGPTQQRVLDKLVGLTGDPTVSETVANSAAWAVYEIMAYPNAPTGPLPAVTALVSAAKTSADASSSKRLWDEARKLAATCSGDALRDQCDAALN